MPTLLVLGALPKLPLGNKAHLPRIQEEGFEALDAARKAVEVIVRHQRLKLAQAPKPKPMDVFNVLPGSNVLVYIEKKRSWEGPYRLVK